MNSSMMKQYITQCLYCLGLALMIHAANEGTQDELVNPERELEQSKEPAQEKNYGNYGRNLFGRGVISKRPPSSSGPTVVMVDLFINSFDSVSVESMDYALQVYVRQRWLDPRLKYSHYFNNVSKIMLDSLKMPQIWLPDLFFQNEKMAHFHTQTIPNRLIRIYPDGSIFYSMRITLRLTCNMKLQKFPMDKQTCLLKMESYGYETDELVLKWKETFPVETKEVLELPQFDITDMVTEECDGHYSTGNFSCIQLRFQLSRKYGYYMVQTYVPSLLIVCVSWVSFWINIDAVPARISLGVLTVLTMTTQSIGLWMTLPKASYVKAIDAWMAICVVFVFCAMLEFAIINKLARKEIRQMSLKYKEGADKIAPDTYQKILNEYAYAPSKDTDPEGRFYAKRIDKMCRYAFPASFLVYNFVYWIVLLSADDFLF